MEKEKKEKKKQTPSQMEFVDRLNKYIPSLVLQHLLIKQERESTVSSAEI